MNNTQMTKAPSRVKIVEGTITQQRKEHDGVILIPRPSDDPRDPLVTYLLTNIHQSLQHSLTSPNRTGP